MRARDIMHITHQSRNKIINQSSLFRPTTSNHCGNTDKLKKTWYNAQLLDTSKLFKVN